MALTKLNIIKEEDEEEETDINIALTDKESNEDSVVEFEYYLNNELSKDFAQLQGRAVFTDAGSVQHLFHSEIEKGNIHNNKIKNIKRQHSRFRNGRLIYRRKSKHRGRFTYY